VCATFKSYEAAPTEEKSVERQPAPTENESIVSEQDLKNSEDKEKENYASIPEGKETEQINPNNNGAITTRPSLVNDATLFLRQNVAVIYISLVVILILFKLFSLKF